MEIKFLLDSNIIIDFLGSKFHLEANAFIATVIDELPNISVVTKIEILSYYTNQQEYNLLKSFCIDSYIFNLTDEIIDKTIQIRIKYKTKTPDAIIAATAIVNNLVLVTRNINDFNKIEDLTVINPWDL